MSFLNEAQHLGSFLESMEGQLRFPDLLALVDDGSSDASLEIAREFAARRKDVRVLQRPRRPAERDRLAHAAELRAFQWGLEQIEVEVPWDVVVKMDADLRLSSDSFQTMERAFLDRPTLGIAGCYLSVLDGRTGLMRREPCLRSHVRGPNKFYRRECFEQISPIPAFLGWDTIDEITARMRGWKTMSLECPQGDTIHLRPTGVADGQLRAQYRWGSCAYGIGQHPLWVMLSTVRRVRDRPRVLGAVAFLAGWVTATMRRHPRATPEVRAHGRDEQLAELRRRVCALGAGRRSEVAF